MVLGRFNYAFDQKDEKVHSEQQKDIPTLEYFSNETATYPAAKEKEEGGEENGEKKEALFKGRRFIVEPTFLMMFIFHFTSFPITAQYHYYALGERRNLTAWMNAAKEESIRNNRSGDGICGKTDNYTLNSPAYRLQQEVQAETARFNFYMDLIGDIPVVFVILFMGTFMDKMGRKPALIIPLVGVIVRAFIYVTQMLTDLPVEFIWLTGVTDCLSGGLSTFFGAIWSIYADTLPGPERGKRMVVADVVYGLSAAVVSFFMGFVVDNFGFLAPFLWIIPGHFLNLAYIVFFVPETGPKIKKKSTVSPKYFYRSFGVFKKKREGNGKRMLLLVAVAYLMFGFTRGAMKQEIIYKMNSPFCWTSTMLGVVGSASAIVMNLTQIMTATFILRWIGEVNCIILSLTSGMVDQIVTGVAQTSWQLMLGIFVGAFQGSSMPFIRSTMSQVIERGEQGALNSFLSASGQLLGLLSSFVFANIYAETLYVYKGTVFLIAAGILSIVITLFFIFKHYKNLQIKTTDVVVESQEETKEKDSSKEKEAQQEAINVHM